MTFPASDVAHEELLARHRAVLPSWLSLNYKHPISLVSGSGRHVTDATGRRYLDFYGGILTTSVGHNLKEITDAIETQLHRIVHSSTLYLIEPQIELAERIADLAPIANAKVFFTNSGTEANEAALLLATKYRSSNAVLALRNSYHGRSFGTMAVTGNQSWSTSPLSPLTVTFIDIERSRRTATDRAQHDRYLERLRNDLDDVLATSLSSIPACLIVEPIQGVGGFISPLPDVLRTISSAVKEKGALVVSDEVQTGWWRTGVNCFGCELHDFQPDLITFAKGLANGFPIGGVVASAEVMDCLEGNSLSTFGGNPLATTAALATLNYIEQHDLKNNVVERGKQLLMGLSTLRDLQPAISDIRGTGLMVGVEFVAEDGTTPDAARTTAAMEAARESGVLIGRGGLHGNVLRIAPPMSITETEMQEGVERLVGALSNLRPPSPVIE